MQRNRESRDNPMQPDDLFDGFGSRRSTMSSMFGGRDPFDDPFFTRPFGSISGSGMFESSGPFGISSQGSKSKGPVIEELDGGEEEDEEEEGHDRSDKNEKSEAPNKNRSNKNPIVVHPDDEDNEEPSKDVSYRTDFNRVQGTKPQSRSFSYQKVSYGGVDGTYYTATTTRKKGGDGVLLEESKQADKTTGQASHRISRGLHDKGHSLLRKMSSAGKVDTMQTLHNLEEDELTGFNDAWRGNIERHFGGSNYLGDTGGGASGIRQVTRSSDFPFAYSTGESGSTRHNNEGRVNRSDSNPKKVVRLNIE